MNENKPNKIYFNPVDAIIGADEDDAFKVSTATLESQLFALEERLIEVVKSNDKLGEANTLLQISRIKLGLEQNRESWDIARKVFDTFIENHAWDQAVECCDVMFQSSEKDALPALGQGVWLSVSFPVDPELTLTMLQHIVEDTPDDADGAAVAAAVALYIVELRASEAVRDNLLFFSNQLLGTVARRHSQVDTQDQFEFWLQKMELNEVDKILVRLRNVIDVLVQEDWWFDQAELQQLQPVN